MNKFSLFNKLNHWIPTRWSMVRKKAVHCKFNSTLPWHFAWHFAWHSWHSCHSCHISLALFCVRPSFELSPDDPSVRRGLQQVRHLEPVTWGLSDHSQSYFSPGSPGSTHDLQISVTLPKSCVAIHSVMELVRNHLFSAVLSSDFSLDFSAIFILSQKPLSHVTDFKLQCSS